MTHRSRRRFDSTDGRGDVADPKLGDITETETISDVVDVDEFTRRLPAGWGVTADVVPFGDEPLTEALLLRRSPEDPKLLLKPAEMANPSGRVEFYEREAGGDRERVLATDSLGDAVRAATNWVHQRTE